MTLILSVIEGDTAFIDRDTALKRRRSRILNYQKQERGFKMTADICTPPPIPDTHKGHIIPQCTVYYHLHGLNDNDVITNAVV